MIVYHKNNEIDREHWDTCIRHSQGVKPYAYSWFLDIMAHGWEALVDDDYDSVFPLPCYSRFGIRLISTPPFVQQLGAFSPDKSAANSLVEFLQYMPDIYRRIDLCVAQKVSVNGFKVAERQNSELDICKRYERLREIFTPNCKRILDTLQKKKQDISDDITPDELLDLHFRNERKGFHGILATDYQRLKNLMNFCIKNKKGRIIGVRATRKKLLFGLFIVETQGRITMLFQSNSVDGINKKSAYLVVNQLISENAGTKNILDFGTSSVHILDSFAESFGCENIPYYRITRNSPAWLVRLLR